MVTPIVFPIVSQIVFGILLDEFPNSIWGGGGVIQCAGILYCDQIIPC